MKKVFADTAYWIAICDKRDEHHEVAVEISKKALLVFTSEMVLTEFLNFFAGKGQQLRGMAIDVVNKILDYHNIRIDPQTRDNFNNALDLYKKHNDKNWSLTDCSSIVICKQRGLTEVLTADHHFEQAGFTILLKKQPA